MAGRPPTQTPPQEGKQILTRNIDKRTRRYTTIDPEPSQVPSTEIVKIDLGNNGAYTIATTQSNERAYSIIHTGLT